MQTRIVRTHLPSPSTSKKEKTEENETEIKFEIDYVHTEQTAAAQRTIRMLPDSYYLPVTCYHHDI